MKACRYATVSFDYDNLNIVVSETWPLIAIDQRGSVDVN